MSSTTTGSYQEKDTTPHHPPLGKGLSTPPGPPSRFLGSHHPGGSNSMAAGGGGTSLQQEARWFGVPGSQHDLPSWGSPGASPRNGWGGLPCPGGLRDWVSSRARMLVRSYRETHGARSSPSQGPAPACNGAEPLVPMGRGRGLSSGGTGQARPPAPHTVSGPAAAARRRRSGWCRAAGRGGARSG